jgi:hypothetical protein
MSDTELLTKEIQSLPVACVHEALDSYIAENSPRTIEEALEMAEAKAAVPDRKPISRHFGTLPGAFGNGVAYQRAMRDEWS